MFVIRLDVLAVAPWRDDGLGLHRRNLVKQTVCIKGLIGDNDSNIQHSFEQGFGLSDVVTLTAGQSKAREIAESIDCRMNLGTQSPTRTAKTLLPLFFSAPAACWCARTMVLSRNTSSKSASSESVAKIFCQTPLSAQREKRLKTLFHGPNSGGRSRHGTPVRAIHNTASTKSRLSVPVRPRCPAFPWSNDSIRSHWSSRSSNLGILSSSKRQNVNTIRGL